MNKFPVLMLVCMAAFLAGCDEKTPNDVLTAKTIRPYAEVDLQDGLVIDNFKRQNGWQDTNAINVYNVRYSYDLKLTKPLPDVTLAAAHAILKELADAKKNPGPMGLKSMQVSMGLSMGVSEWIGAQQQPFAERRDAFLSRCQPCLEYWNHAGTDELVRERRNAFVYAWSALEEKGFKDGATTGGTVPRVAWAPFMKTEQGWAAKQ